MTDPLDQPEDDEAQGLLFPFIVCESNGGPYADDPFTAGFEAGRIDRALVVAAAADANRLQFTARTALVPQLELIGMARGFPVMTAEQVEETEDHPAMPEWSYVTFTVSAES